VSTLHRIPPRRDADLSFLGHVYGSAAAAHDANVKPPLPPLGTLPVNYGHGGGETLCFALDKKLDVDVGFAKMFFANVRFDLLVIEQKALETAELGGGRRGCAPQNKTSAGRVAKMWDEITLPVLQVRSLD
jgi:hypothetical protein